MKWLSRSAKYLSSVKEDKSKKYESNILLQILVANIPKRFFFTLSGFTIFGEYMEYTETYEGRNATSMIPLLVAVIKNKQMEYIEQNRTKPNTIEQN